MKKDYISVADIAEMFDVTPPAVRYWLSKGLAFKTEKVMGRKTRKIISPEDVKDYLKIGIRK